MCYRQLIFLFNLKYFVYSFIHYYYYYYDDLGISGTKPTVPKRNQPIEMVF